jgi:hypothetical protein
MNCIICRDDKNNLCPFLPGGFFVQRRSLRGLLDLLPVGSAGGDNSGRLLVARCWRILFVLLVGILPFMGCGSLRTVPGQFNAADYTPIDFELLVRDSSSLRAGELVRCQAFFWQFLTHDPAPQYYYFNQLAYPLRWGELEWFALYQQADMRGYFDRGVMSRKLRQEFKPQRLDPVIIYGELVPMGGSMLYLLVHHLERFTID